MLCNALVTKSSGLGVGVSAVALGLCNALPTCIAKRSHNALRGGYSNATNRTAPTKGWERCGCWRPAPDEAHGREPLPDGWGPSCPSSSRVRPGQLVDPATACGCRSRHACCSSPASHGSRGHASPIIHAKCFCAAKCMTWPGAWERNDIASASKRSRRSWTSQTKQQPRMLMSLLRVSLSPPFPSLPLRLTPQSGTSRSSPGTLTFRHSPRRRWEPGRQRPHSLGEARRPFLISF